MDAPEFISPNEDGLNDLFVVRGINPKEDNRIIIFNRQGVVVFEQLVSGVDLKKLPEGAKLPEPNRWDGTSKGKLVDPGTYFYKVTNGTREVKGFVEVKY